MIIDPDTVRAASLKSVDVFKAIVGDNGHCLVNNKFPVVEHPLITSIASGNEPVAKFVIEWIRSGGVRYIDDVVSLKRQAVLAACTTNLVSIVEMLSTDKEVLVEVFKNLILIGHIDSAKHIATTDTRLDFSENDFQLLRVCAPFPSLLQEVVKSKSLEQFEKAMPTVYSQIVMDTMKERHKKTKSNVRKKSKVTKYS
jgi:hypothetical protein